MSFNKYSAKRTHHAGRSFASQGEASCYDYLLVLEQLGEIKILQCQDHLYLSDARILFIPDFKIMNVKENRIEWAEFKGLETTDYRIKRKLYTVYGPGPLRVYKGSGKRIYLHETIIPKGGEENGEDEKENQEVHEKEEVKD